MIKRAVQMPGSDDGNTSEIKPYGGPIARAYNYGREMDNEVGQNAFIGCRGIFVGLFLPGVKLD
jgi:hypothetical protein